MRYSSLQCYAPRWQSTAYAKALLKERNGCTIALTTRMTDTIRTMDRLQYSIECVNHLSGVF